MNDATTEQAIQAAGANVAPRITPDDISANIVSEHYFTAAQGALGFACNRSWFEGNDGPYGEPGREPGPLDLLTLCVIVLRNGFTVTGESACASQENFNTEIGQRIARQNAVAKIWPLMGYQLRQHLHEARDVGTYGAAIEGGGSRSLCTCGPNMACTNCSNKQSS